MPVDCGQLFKCSPTATERIRPPQTTDRFNRKDNLRAGFAEFISGAGPLFWVLEETIKRSCINYVKLTCSFCSYSSLFDSDNIVGSMFNVLHICITKSKDAPPTPLDRTVMRELYGISAPNANCRKLG